MGYFTTGMGWNLPPGISERRLDEAQEQEPNHGRRCKCQDCQDEMADLDFERKGDR